MRSLILFLLMTLFASPLFAQDGPPPARVKTITLTSQSAAPMKEFTGSVYFDRISQVSSEVSGLVDEVRFREGDRVKKGQVLAKLNTDFTLQEIARIKANIRKTVAQLDHAKKDLKRYEELLSQQATSATSYDQLFFQVREIEAQKSGYQAELKTAELTLQKSTIYAPFGGLVLEKNIDIGSWITSGSFSSDGGIARLASLDDIYVQVAVNETITPFSKAGQPVDVLLTATNQQLQGTHQGFRPIADLDTKNVFVRVKLNDVPQVFENMSAKVNLPIGTHTTQLLVPRDALITFNGGDFVYSVNEGKAAIIPIAIDGYNGDQAAISSQHLQPGMPIIVEGNERVRPDQPVNVIGNNE